MPIIEHKTKTIQEPIIQPGSLLVVPDRGIYFMVCQNQRDSHWSIIDMEDGTVERSDLNHPAHIVNYLKKEYGEFHILSVEDYKIVIND